MAAFDLLEEWSGPDEAAVPVDRRMMEGRMARLLGETEQSSLDPKVKKAQDLMYKAWDEQNPAKRLSLAHRALGVSADCADAYVLLAEEEAISLEQALDYYQKGVSAGERALGKRFFKENTGYFWSLLETRPYMRALEGKARCLWEMKQKEEALSDYQEMLHLNPNDNQGIRYVLVELFLQLNRDAELEKLVKKYKDDWSVAWLYTQALLAFRKSGPSASANRKLQVALEENPHVTAYLTGKKRIPQRSPDLIERGGESEAVEYASAHLNHWRKTPGAVEWLLGQKPKSQRPARKAAGGGGKKRTTRK
jgi:tetratricopeptide (TPR) repeat protein